MRITLLSRSDIGSTFVLVAVGVFDERCGVPHYYKLIRGAEATRCWWVILIANKLRMSNQIDQIYPIMTNLPKSINVSLVSPDPIQNRPNLRPILIGASPGTAEETVSSGGRMLKCNLLKLGN